MKTPTAIVSAIVAAGLLLSGCSSADDASTSTEPQTSLNIAMTPMGDDPTAVNPVDVFTGLLSQSTGLDVDVTDVPDYLSVVEALRGGHVDLALMSAFPSALAIGTGAIDPLVAWKSDGKPVSTCMVKADSPIRSLADLRGKKVAFADQASSSGYFMPVHMLDRAGLTRGKDYQAVFAGSHDAGWIALSQGGVDATCTAFVLADMSVAKGVFKPGETRNVGESAGMPVSTVILVRKNMNQATRDKLIEVLPALFADHAAELGVLGKGREGAAIANPDASIFAELGEIAAVAGVTLQNMGS